MHILFLLCQYNKAFFSQVVLLKLNTSLANHRHLV